MQKPLGKLRMPYDIISAIESKTDIITMYSND